MKGEVQKPDSRIESVWIVFAGGWMSVCVCGEGLTMCMYVSFCRSGSLVSCYGVSL